MDARSTLSLIAISLGLTVAGTGTYAFFTDTGFSDQNVFTMSTLDMHLANDGGPFQEGVNATLGNANFSPGDQAEGTLFVRNDGTIEAHKVDLDVAFAVSVTDNRTNGARMDRNLTLLNLSYNSEDLLAKVCWRTAGDPTFRVLQDANANGRLDVHDLRTQACEDLAVANLAQVPGGYPFRMLVEFWTGAGNHDQGDIVRLNMTFRMGQIGAADLLPSEADNLLSDDFNGPLNTADWISTSGASVNSNCGAHSAPDALWFGTSGMRQATTRAMNLGSVSTVSFYLKIGNGSFPCEHADQGEEVVLEYSTNGGTSWTNIATYSTLSFDTFTLVNQALPAGAQDSSVNLRWRQVQHSGESFDHWAIDNVRIPGAP